MNKKGIVFLIVVVILFIGSTILGLLNQQKMENKFDAVIPEEAKNVGLKAVDYYTTRDYEGVITLFIDKIKEEENIQSNMIKVSDMLQNLGKLEKKEIIGCDIKTMNGKTTYNITIQLKYEKKYMLYNFLIIKEENDYKLYNTYFEHVKESLRQTNKFSFKNKSIWHYIILILNITMLLGSIIIASIAFSKSQNKRWLWSILSLSGIGLFYFNWSTGNWGINPLSIGIPVATINRTGTFAPIIFNLRFPVGALIYWLTKHKSDEKNIKNDNTLGNDTLMKK